jgi:hypothetical protein
MLIVKFWPLEADGFRPALAGFCSFTYFKKKNSPNFVAYFKATPEPSFLFLKVLKICISLS